MAAGRRVYAYIDETGDRGSSSESSPIFGMAAVVVDDAGAVELRSAIARLRADLGVAHDKVMSWKEHVKTHDRRRRAAEVLGGVRGLSISYVYSVKSELRAGSYLEDPQRFYNYVAYKLYKSILWSARSWKGPQCRVWTRFGHVRGHDHRSTKDYIEREAAAYLLSIWHQLRGSDTCAIPLGIMPMPRYGLLRESRWFPCPQCTK